MADSISSSKQLTIQIETKYNTNTSDTKKVNLIVPNPKNNLTETEIKTAVNGFIRAGNSTYTNQTTYYYIDSTTGEKYYFGTYTSPSSVSHFDSQTQILTAYTTAETITVVDIGVEDS